MGMNTETNCVAGCNHFSGGELKHHKDCPHYPDSMSERYDRQDGEISLLREYLEREKSKNAILAMVYSEAKVKLMQLTAPKEGAK